MARKYPSVSSRVEPEVMERVEQEAARTFFGNTSMVTRVGVELYLELRELFGPRYEIVVEELRQRGRQEEQAA